MTFSRRAKALSIFLKIMLAAYPLGALAQTVSVTNGLGERGHGWMFRHQGACHVAMPRHVAGPLPRVTITTAAPMRTATARVLSPFWEGIDLSVGIVRAGLEERCTARLGDFRAGDARLQAQGGVLERVTPGGDLERSPVRLMDRGYLTFSAVVAEGAREIAQGTSGAFVLLEGQPAGMAITSDDPGRASFMRSGEIAQNLERFLSAQGAVAPAGTPSEGAGSARAEAALPLVLHTSTVPPVNPGLAPENMTSEGRFVFAPDRHMRFVFGMDGGEARPVSRLRIRSTPQSGETSPKDVIVRWSVAAAPQGFETWTRGTVARDGVFDTGAGAARSMRWIEVIVLNAWAGGDIVIDAVTAY